MKYAIVVLLVGALALVGCAAPSVVPIEEVDESPPVVVESSGAITAIPTIYEVSERGSTGVEPPKYTISNFSLGSEADLPITLHNGTNESISFIVSYRVPSYTEEGYAPMTAIGESWLSFEPSTPVLQPKEKNSFIATLHLPSDAVVPDKWEFWIAIKEAGQTGQVQTEICVRVFVNMH